jgi:hypothetical protein
VTLGGNEMENDKYEWMSLEVNSNGMKSLGKSLGKFQGFPNELSDLPSVNTCPRHKENNAYNVIC